MNRDDVIHKLRAHEPELKAAGIVRLAGFGSVASGDNSPESSPGWVRQDETLYVADHGKTRMPPCRFAWNKGRSVLSWMA